MRGSRSVVGRGSLLLLVAATLVLSLAGSVVAQSKSKSKMSEGKLMAIDREAGTITVRQKGKPVVYHAVFEGSVLTRTTATMNAKPVKLEEIPVDAPVIVYWRPDEDDRKRRNARKVDAPKVSEEFLEDYE